MTSIALKTERAASVRTATIVLGAGIPAAAIIALAGPPAALLLTGGLVVVLATIFAPGVVLALLLLVPFYKGAAQAYVPVDITVLLAVLNLVQLIPVLRDRRRIDRSVIGLVLWGTLPLLLTAGILYAPDQDLAISRAATFVALLFLPALPAAFRVVSEQRYLRQFLFTIFGLGALTVVLGLLALSRTERLLVLGTDTISVSRAAILVPILGLTFVARDAHRWIRLLATALIPLAIIVAIASGSRGPLLVALIMAATGATIRIARVRTIDWKVARTIAALTIGFGVILAVAAPALPSSSIGRFTLLWDFAQGEVLGDRTPGGDASSGARLDLFGAALKMFSDRPIAGYGTGSFEVISRQILGPNQPNAYPHNAVFQFASEFGLVGLFLFLGLITIGLGRPLPPHASSSALRILFVFFLLNAMVSGDIFEDRITWGLLVLMISLDSGRHIAGQRPTSKDPGVCALVPRPLDR